MRIRLAAAVVAATLAQGLAWADDVTTLVEAAKAGDEAAASGLLQQHADVNAPESDGTTALHWAVYRNDETLVTQLIRAGANVNAKNKFDSTPMS